MSKIAQDTVTAKTNFGFVTATETRALTFAGRGGNIPDGQGCFVDEIVVTDNFNVTSVTVTLNNFVHTWVGDLAVRLRHRESGTVVELFRRPGQPKFSSSGYNSDLNGDYSFSYNSTSNFELAASKNTEIPTGNYASTGDLSAFRGLASSGTWQLMINDYSAGDSGSLGSWNLELGWG